MKQIEKGFSITQQQCSVQCKTIRHQFEDQYTPNLLFQINEIKKEIPKANKTKQNKKKRNKKIIFPNRSVKHHEA